MKIIEFGPLLFRLPDEFAGDVPEALRLLADYYASAPSQTPSQHPKRGRPTKVATAYEEFRDERREKFFTAVAEGARLDGLISLMQGDESQVDEVDIDKGWK